VVAGALDCSGRSFGREGEIGFGLALHKYNVVVSNCYFVVAGTLNYGGWSFGREGEIGFGLSLYKYNVECRPEPSHRPKLNPSSLALSGISLTCNESIDDVELVVDGDEVHSPIVAQKKGRLLHKRKMSTVEKVTVKKSQRIHNI
jgi:hypothetical protein